MKYKTHFGLFVVVLVGTFVLVRYFGAPGKIIPIGVSLLILVIGINVVINSLRKRKNDN